MKSVHFLEKKFSMTKKKSRQNFFRELKETFKDFFLKIYFQKIFAPPIFVTQIFAPPIFMTSLRPCSTLPGKIIKNSEITFFSTQKLPFLTSTIPAHRALPKCTHDQSASG